MTRAHEVSRTLVKSPPELWAECSDPTSLGRHLDQFGEIRITRLEPDTAVAWEGESISGTVRLEPSGWGTKVILTAAEEAGAQQAELTTTPEPEAVEPPKSVSEVIQAAPKVEPAQSETPPPVEPLRVGLLARLRAWFAPPPTDAVTLTPLASARPLPEEQQEPVTAEELEPAAPEPAPDPTSTALSAALDSLGQAHHRPFSRA